MGVRRTAIVKNNYKDASYLLLGGGGGSGGSTNNKSPWSIGGHGGSGGNNIQLAMQKETDRKKQKVKNELREFKDQLEIIEKIRRQEAKIDAEIKQDQMQRNMIDPKVWDTHTQDISSPKLRNIFKDIDTRHRITLCDMIEREERDNPKEDNFIIKIIKNIGKKKPPKNMTIVQ
jgi:hypothetical protein